ncbi:MAG TPA: class II aldolase/adducin family protein, partial [bacterium]|nr:class II aldolase/adducin family protein [bacterium]
RRGAYPLALRHRLRRRRAGRPCLTTGQADVFGGEIPATPYADNRGDRIGRAILKARRPGCPAVILGGHGLFAFGPDPVAAVKAARLAEYFARLNCFALLLGRSAGRELTGLAAAEVRKWNRRYQGGGYGQEPARRGVSRR